MAPTCHRNRADSEHGGCGRDSSYQENPAWLAPEYFSRTRAQDGSPSTAAGPRRMADWPRAKTALHAPHEVPCRADLNCRGTEPGGPAKERSASRGSREAPRGIQAWGPAITSAQSTTGTGSTGAQRRRKEDSPDQRLEGARFEPGRRPDVRRLTLDRWRILSIRNDPAAEPGAFAREPLKPAGRGRCRGPKGWQITRTFEWPAERSRAPSLLGFVPQRSAVRPFGGPPRIVVDFLHNI